MRKFEHVLINGGYYGLWDLEKEHEGPNGEPKSWWVYTGNGEPFREDDPGFVPYNSSLKRLVWSLHFEETNSMKEKYGSTRFSHSVTCTMYINGKEAYEFRAGDINYAINKAQTLMVELFEQCSFNYADPESQNGRKILWHGLPATIWVYGISKIRVRPEVKDTAQMGHWWINLYQRLAPTYPKKEDLEDFDEDYQEWKRNGEIVWGDPFKCPHINWCP